MVIILSYKLLFTKNGSSESQIKPNVRDVINTENSNSFVVAKKLVIVLQNVSKKTSIIILNIVLMQNNSNLRSLLT